MFSENEVYTATKEYFNGNELATSVFMSKYALKNKEGQFLELTPKYMHKRLAKEFYNVNRKFRSVSHSDMSDYGKERMFLTEDEIFELFDEFKNIIPQGSVMAVLGDENYIGSLSNCVVIDSPHDSYGGIMYTDEQLTHLMKRRSGVGFDISTLRPSGMSVSNVAKQSTGAVSFMSRFSNTTREVAQGGRRGALLLSINCKHPDIMEFITVKRDLTKVTGANISVLWTDDFMQAVQDNSEFTLRFPVDKSPEEAQFTKIVNAKAVWDLAVQNAHASAEPGMIFIDTMKRYSTCDPYAPIVSTNPCQPSFARVLTENGITSFGELKTGDKIYSESGWTKVLAKWSTGIKAVYDYNLHNSDFSFMGTDNHKVVTKEKGKIEIDKAFNNFYLVNTIDNEYLSIESKVYIGDYEVFDITVDNDSHTYYTNGVNVSNCGEVSMSKNDSCRLIALNIFGSVINPYTEYSDFDFEHWYKICYEGQVLSDDLVQLELEHVEKILDKIEHDPEPDYIKAVEKRTWEDLYDSGKNGRRTGLGFTGLGDSLAALGLKYDEALEVVDRIMLTKFRAEWDATTDLAIERGAMPLWEEKGFLETEFTDFLKEVHPEAYERMKKHGRRNISISTVAPTGSLSMLAKLKNHFGTTSGIEPLFAPWYTRRKKINGLLDNKDSVDFVDELGDSWTEFYVFHNGLIEWAETNNIPVENIVQEYENSPYFNACSNDINWIKRVELQACIQKYVTHSISSTVNLPSSSTVQDVENIYLEAYKQGIKGITVYVDGSRDGVLITSPKEDKIKIKKTNAPKRPKSLPCTVFNTSIKGQYWLVIIGFLENDPYEVFAFPNGKVSYKEGYIIKKARGQYDLEIDGKIVVENIPTHYENDEQESLTRLISTALRHGSDAKFIIEQLDKSSGTIVSFSKAVARALKHTLEIGTELKVSCKQCNSINVIFQEGCYSCQDCGMSGCS